MSVGQWLVIGWLLRPRQGVGQPSAPAPASPDPALLSSSEGALLVLAVLAAGLHYAGKKVPR